MRRVVLSLIALAVATVAASGCQRSVAVETGVRVQCPYGHVDDGDVQTIEVAAKAASSYSVTTEKRVCDRHQRLEALYAEAQAALASGDLATAKSKLTQVAEDERGFRKTAAQLAAIARGEKPTADTDDAPDSQTPAEPKPGEGDTDAPIGSLKGYVPDTIDGFTARPVLTEPLSITREYDPISSSRTRLLTIVAEQFRKPSEAESALSRQMAFYPESASKETVGARTVRFGSDGRRFVSVAFTKGAVLVIIELASQPDVDPIKLKGTVLDVAAALP